MTKTIENVPGVRPVAPGMYYLTEQHYFKRKHRIYILFACESGSRCCGLRLSTLAQQYFSPLRAHHHYLSMAKKTVSRYLQLGEVRHKKYFYTPLPLLAAHWIRQNESIPPMQLC